MTKTLRLLVSSLFGLLMLTACTFTSTVPTPAPSPTAISNQSLPTPASPGKMIVYDDLQVTMSEAEITTSYLNEYGSRRAPPADEKFLWIHVSLKNIGQQEQTLPETEHFSILYGPSEFKPSYGHRNGYADYMVLKTALYQGQEVDAWLRFDIPAVAELRDLWFAFLPEGSRVSISFSPAQYPWGDHPIYLWTCAP